MEPVWAAALSFCLCLALTPLVRRISVPAKAYARQNHRTIHHGKISRIGGVAIYIAFCVSISLFMSSDQSIIGIFLAATIMFFTGLLDDFYDLSPLVKLIFQIFAALVLIFFGVSTDTIHLPFGIAIDNTIVSGLFTMVWVVGIVNAVNLSDGLDGLAGGMGVVVLSLVTAICMVDRRLDLIPLCSTLIGALLGFLVFNAHPASIFMGDCGALFLGTMIASISLLGFKSSTIMTLALPILLMMLPILDTFSAIIRRRLKGHSFSQADKEHMHHQLMKRFGQQKTVIIMCGITFLFGLCAFLYIYSKKAGLIALLVIFLGLDLFVEKTGMISASYRPVLSFVNSLLKKENPFAGLKKPAAKKPEQKKTVKKVKRPSSKPNASPSEMV